MSSILSVQQHIGKKDVSPYEYDIDTIKLRQYAACVLLCYV
jgi:hypothetical protein